VRHLCCKLLHHPSDYISVVTSALPGDYVRTLYIHPFEGDEALVLSCTYTYNCSLSPLCDLCGSAALCLPYSQPILSVESILSGLPSRYEAGGPYCLSGNDRKRQSRKLYHLWCWVQLHQATDHRERDKIIRQLLGSDEIARSRTMSVTSNAACS
jgi:hypothetical protein